MESRRTFVKHSLLAAGALVTCGSCKFPGNPDPDIKISLAEWSFNRELYAGTMDHLDFPRIAKEEFGISAVEYVNGFFGGGRMDPADAAIDTSYLGELLKRSRDAGVTNHLIMVDDEGPLSSTVEKERMESVENHMKWIEAASILGCSTIRVNLHGEGPPDQRKKAAVDSLGQLGEIAGTMELNIVVENHGGITSDAIWLSDVIQQVNMGNVGTLPDFGNWCISHPWGTIQEGCAEMFDIYEGIALLLQFAKGVSAKTYDFNDAGEQPLLDYRKLTALVKDSGFKGYIGIEYEGWNPSEYEGVRKTQALLKKYL